ncbi:hypothetical protein PBY51_007312 [Eleginops maclovinus]|uniref:Uncharacterized protein n=1 Tax=Eleginops maclovinus TaxID=56733 RepID=A0AAN7X813_ELEMC|nr:hypothetical protein PBY51_007312 [Eleginops maclovinus]
MEAYQYHPESVEELLPRYGSAHTRAVKQMLEDNKLLLSYQGYSDVDMQPTCRLPVIRKKVDSGRCLDPAGIEAFHLHANGIQELLPRYGTAQTRAIKQKLERNKLLLNYEDNIEDYQQPTPLPAITTKDDTECLVPAGMEAYSYCPESVEESLPRYSNAKTRATKKTASEQCLDPAGIEVSHCHAEGEKESLPRYGTPQTRAIKQKLEGIKQLLSHQGNSESYKQATHVLSIKKTTAGRCLDPAGIEASHYHANGIQESLPRYGTAQTRAIKQKLESNKQLLSHQGNSERFKQATRVAPISTKKTTAGRCLDPTGIDMSHYHAEGVKESLPRKVNVLQKHIPPLSKKEAPGPLCSPGVPEGSNYYFKQTGEQLPRYGTAQTRSIKQRQEQNKLFLGWS